MNIYTEEGWPNIRKIRSQGCPFIMLIGGRGTGKTYSTLLDVLEHDFKNGGKFIYLRRTAKQVEACCTEKFNPFRRINYDTGWNVHAKRGTNDITFVEVEQDGETETEIGSGLSLSTVSNVRGIDAFDTRVIVYDEFIKDKTERRFKGEAEALFNFYETINRNRELEGKEPVQLIMLANANDSANAVFTYLNLVMICERQKQKGVYPAIYKNPERGIFMADFGPTNPISEQKKDTALYRLTAGTQYAKMAIENEYSYNEPSKQAHRPLNEYKPIVFVGELAVYQHKGHTNEFYCTDHKSGAAPQFSTGDTELARFRRAFAWLWYLYLSDRIEFENYTCEILLTNYFNM